MVESSKEDGEAEERSVANVVQLIGERRLQRQQEQATAVAAVVVVDQ